MSTPYRERIAHLLPAAAFVAGGVVLFCSGDRAGGVGLFLGIGAALVWAGLAFVRRVRRTLPPRKTASLPAVPSSSSFTGEVERDPSRSSDEVDLTVLGARYTRTEWEEMERIVDQVLDACIGAIRARIQAHTVAIFFPTEDGGYKIRRHFSKSEYINKDAVIYPGVGVIGSFLKDGLKQLYLREIVTDSMTLYYYHRDASIRSLMATPIPAGGAKRGTIVVDSTEEEFFTDDDHDFLTTVAALCGHGVYYAYLYNESKLRYARLTAMSSTEKYFFQKHEIESVLDKMAEIIPFAIPCDRVTISVRCTDGESAQIRRAWGSGSEQLLGRTFSLRDKSLVGLLYSRNMCFYRDFSPDHYEVRYSDDEPRTREMISFLAFPLGVDECKGALLLESTQSSAFSDANRALLSRLATSAALAIEKIQILEQARSLATHDGLTGLNNHRQFQKLLRDEITRARRYKEPLALTLCDIDFFKKCNDTHGHQFGDTVLAGIARVLQESVREGVDIAARYGGEEFALILVKTDVAMAVETVERIRQNIAKQTFMTPLGEEIHITMSFGIAVLGVHADKIDALIQKADKALYRAKENGRNRAEVF